MNYEGFLTQVQKSVSDIMGEEGKVSVSHIIKNNGMELDGLIIMMENSNVSPTIYLNSYYAEHCAGRPFEEIVDNIMEVYLENKDKVSICADFFLNFENIKDKIVYKVINYDQNKKLLQKVPHKKILDLAVVFYCLIEQGELGNATALIYNTHMQTWNVDVDTIYEIAMENTPKLLKSNIKKMADIIKELFMQENNISEDEGLDIFDKMDTDDISADMFVLTNISRINGAACMLYEDVLSNFANSIDSDLYILPSSIHEVIIVPQVNNLDKTELCQMVKEVNAEGVADDEILSDHVYVYNRTDHTITL
ncbi:DUF5688 family protein [[Clostridium] fimetarium]|uniref:Uncharacterized protein n=1 Tax=[Clostridium] fimetarium TaxID=99656 RepID=A0A1I0RGZ7_9FIRM|nr:DUF5688 family protein [[Clostridium] fimetarium]SEW40070.1 hypothetical protein SAMN05421659_11592 [[Clostridium] fimetarium]